MDRQTALEIIACLPSERTLFYYYPGRYNIGLLRHLARKPLAVAELKTSPFAALAQRPQVKAILAQFGGNPLTEAQLALLDYDPAQIPFTLSLGLWGTEHSRHWRGKQTSRRGYNLVLQLNFCGSHDRRFRRLGGETDVFQYYGHPVSTRRNTLAWARIDLDWASGTALIEEIQSDWIREVAWLAETTARRLERVKDPAQPTERCGLSCPIRLTLDYCRFVLAGYQSLWAEAMLWAALCFLREELGLARIYYHTSESGRLLKRIQGSAPPLSLYTDLPRKFCFAKTAEPPRFIAQERRVCAALKRHPGTRFHCLDLAPRADGGG